MSQYINHEITFLDTHKHCRPASAISRRLAIVCRCLKLKKSNYQKQMLGFAAYAALEHLLGGGGNDNLKDNFDDLLKRTARTSAGL